MDTTSYGDAYSGILIEFEARKSKGRDGLGGCVAEVPFSITSLFIIVD